MVLYLGLANCYFAQFPQDPKLNVTLLLCAQNSPQDQFARDTVWPMRASESAIVPQF